VYYGCTDDGGGVGCFYGDREWKLCEQPAGELLQELEKLVNCLIAIKT